MLPLYLMKLYIHHSRPTINNSDIKAVSGVLKSAYIASGDAAREFEKRFAKFIKVNSATATNSGTSALHLALLALKVKAHDEVIIPSFVCSSVLDAVLYLGAEPKIIDIDPSDFNLSLKDTKRKINRSTKAIILPHLFGKPADIEGFLGLGIPIIENCSHSLGARYEGRPVGSFGDISIFSFYATKVITTGYGGMVCSKDKDLIDGIKNLIEVDERDNYTMRFNYKMSDLAASLGISQLERLKGFIARRQEIAKSYNKNLKSKNILLPADKEKNHIYFRYVIRIKANLNKIIEALNKKGIEAKRPVFKPLHHYLGLNRRQFPNTETVFNSALSLPIYPSLKKGEAEFIVETLNSLLD